MSNDIYSIHKKTSYSHHTFVDGSLTDVRISDGAIYHESSMTPNSSDTLYGSELNGFGNPGWRSQVKQHLGATTSLFAERRRVRSVPFEALAEGQVFIPGWGDAIRRVERGGTLVPLTYIDPSIYDEVDADNRAIRNLYNNSRGVQTALLAGEDLGEIRETLRSLRRPFSALQDAM
jgi:hypothetical protein